MRGDNCVVIEMRVCLSVVFNDGGDAVIRFEIDINAVERWSVLD